MRTIGDRETLLHIANTWENFPITRLEQAEAFLQYLHDATGGCVRFDFIDESNWDRYESYSASITNGILRIDWYNCPTSSTSRSMAMKFNRIERLVVEDTAYFFLRSYSLTDKEIRNFFSPETEELTISKYRNFSVEISRKIRGRLELITCITSAIFTVLILPKMMNTPSSMSKYLLYLINLDEIWDSINQCKDILSDISGASKSDSDLVCEKSNTVRRNMEIILKIECCFRNINTNKPYSQLRIGDTWGLLKKYHSETTTNLVSRFIKWSNEFSHDTGVEVNKSKAQLAVSIIQQYAILFREEIALDYLQPIWREKEYIAF